MTGALAWIGRASLGWLRALGHAAFFCVELLRHLPAALRRWPLVLAQVHLIGNHSLLIIAASGLAVGFVLALQMYYALVTYGAAENLARALGRCPVAFWTVVNAYCRERSASCTRIVVVCWGLAGCTMIWSMQVRRPA